MSQDEQLDARRNGQAVITVPDPEVRPKAKHRRFAEYKKPILEELSATPFGPALSRKPR